MKRKLTGISSSGIKHYETDYTNFSFNSNILSFQFVGGSSILPMGYSSSSGGISKDCLQFDFFIPNNFFIESAIVTLNHMPVRYYELGVYKYTGYSRNLKLYRVTGVQNGYFYLDYMYFNINTNNYGTWSEIPNAFGVSGFTGSSSGFTKADSINIRGYINNGFNSLRIQTSNAIPGATAQALQETGACNAVLNIIGYYT